MLLDKWKPLYGPEAEVGAEPEVDGGAPPPEAPLNERPVDGPGSGRGEIRKSLEKGFDTARKAEEQEQKDRDAKTGRYKSRARSEMGHPDETGQAEATAEPEAEAETPEQQSEFAVPEGWAKDAKAEWGNLPPAVQAAVAKRETDMAKGVEDLKKSYADLDTVIKPRDALIRQHGHTRAQAVNQLFAWFDALAANPQVAFPALAQSFKYDLRNIPGLVPAAQPQQDQQPQQPPQGQNAPQGQEEVPVYVKQLEEKFSQQLGSLYQNFTQAQQAKTQEILDSWSKDKPYFEDVRRVMGNLIASGTVQPLPNGSADLDKAYDMALYAVPEIRAKILEDKSKAEETARKAEADKQRKLQQEAADKARKAAASISGGAPGSPTQPQKGPRKAKSVRESIEEARKEITDGRRA